MDENARDTQMNEHAVDVTVRSEEPDLNVYPLRDPSEDPRWAVWVAWTWIIIAMGLFLSFVLLAVLGIWYD